MKISRLIATYFRELLDFSGGAPGSAQAGKTLAWNDSTGKAELTGYSNTEVDTALAAKASASEVVTLTAATAAHVASTSNPHAVTKSQVGLADVDNTADANKPISAIQQAALDGKLSMSGNGTDLKALPYFNRESALPTDIKVVSFTIPSIGSGTRRIETVVLGQLRNPTAAILGFFLPTALDPEIQMLRLGTTGGLKDGLKLFPGAVVLNVCTVHAPNLGVGAFGESMLFVTEDYTQSARGTRVSSQERYGSGSGSAFIYNYCFTYQSIGVGVLIGHYGSGGTGGVFQLNANVELESAWLTQSGSDTVLNLAIYNRGSYGGTAEKTIKVAVYE